MKNWERDADCDTSVMLGSMQVKKENVPLGKEFIEDGRTFQTSLGSAIKFDLAALNSTFKFGDAWCAKLSPSSSYTLEPNGPFGHSTSKPVPIRPDQMVRPLVVDERGPK